MTSTDDPVKHYRVEQWSKDFGTITRLILETGDINKARDEFHRVVHHRPRGWYTVRHGTRVIEEHPRT